MPLVAAVQLNGSADLERNWSQAAGLIRAAARAGATLIATPEATDYLGPHDQKAALAEPTDGPRARRYGALAAELGVHLLVGSVAERGPDGPDGGPPTHSYNTSLLFGSDGALVAQYRKIHLFDVDLRAQGGVRFLESERTLPGRALVVADTPLGRLGLSVCYDLRFPELYRGLVDRGATILAVPSAFTLMTGKDHWHTLLRARAIECQAHLIAPAQWGAHDDGGLRRSYGHALIVDPWGTVLAECGDGPGYCVAPIDLDKTAQVRAEVPLARHRVL